MAWLSSDRVERIWLAIALATGFYSGLMAFGLIFNYIWNNGYWERSETVGVVHVIVSGLLCGLSIYKLSSNKRT